MAFSTICILSYSVMHMCIWSCKDVLHCMTTLCPSNSAMIVILIIFDLLSPTESKTMCSASNHSIFDLKDKLEKTMQYGMQILRL